MHNIRLAKLAPSAAITGKQYNVLVDQIKANQLNQFSGGRIIHTSEGVHLIGKRSATAGSPIIAQVVESFGGATAGGRYLCTRRQIDSTHWSTNSAGVLPNFASNVIARIRKENTGEEDEVNVFGIDGKYSSGYPTGSQAIVEGSASAGNDGAYDVTKVLINDEGNTDIYVRTTIPISAIADGTISQGMEVVNMAEIKSSVRNLDAGDYLLAWRHVDDENNVRWLGIEVFGRHTFGEW